MREKGFVNGFRVRLNVLDGCQFHFIAEICCVVVMFFISQFFSPFVILIFLFYILQMAKDGGDLLVILNLKIM